METTWIFKHFNELTANELFELLALRARVFVVEQNCPYQDPDYKDKLSYHLMAFQNERCIACLRLVPAGISYAEWSIGRVATDKSVRMAGWGRAVMNEGLRILNEQFSRPDVRISAQSYLIGFYASFGFTPLGEDYPEDDIPHREMLLKHNH